MVMDNMQQTHNTYAIQKTGYCSSKPCYYLCPYCCWLLFRCIVVWELLLFQGTCIVWMLTNWDGGSVRDNFHQED